MTTTLLSPSNTQNRPANLFFKMSLLMSLLLATVFGHAQVSTNYSLSAALGTFTALPAGKTNLIPTTPANTDSGVYNVALPFTFQFDGVCQSSMNVSMNGFVTFGTAPALTEITPISSATGYSGVIAPYATDLDIIGVTTTFNVSYIVTGTAPNRIYKVEWAVRRDNQNGTAASVDTNSMVFQLWLYETTNVIEVYYNTFNPSSTTVVNAQVGLRGTSSADYKNLTLASGNWPASQIPLGVSNAATVATKGTSGQIAATSWKKYTWTPSGCFQPTGVGASSVASNTATIGWTAVCPTPASGYEYEVRTSGAAGSGATGLAASGSTTSAVTTANLTGLLGGTTYTIYVRSNCGGYSSWTTGVSFTTLCTAANIPYTGMYFDQSGPDGYTIPSLPACTSIQNIGTGNNWVTDGTVEEGFFDEHLMYNQSGTNAANVWFFTKGINLVAGNTYRLSYVYGGSSNISTITNKIEVSYGTSQSAAGMTIQLANHNNIKTSPISNVVNFVAPASGVYYFGFRCYSAANQGRAYLDDIEIVNSICIKPTGLTASSIGYNSATVNWSAPSPTPGSGYEYYLSTAAVSAGAFVTGNTYQIVSLGTTDFTLIGAASNTVGAYFTATGAGTGTGAAVTAPSATQASSGTTAAGTTVVNLSGLSPNTTYYFWVRGNCGTPDDSIWSGVVSFTTGSTPPYCIPPANSSAATYVSNFTATNAITNVNNTSVYTSPGYADYTSMIVTESQSGSFNYSISFTTASLGVHVAIFIDYNGDGDFADAGETAYDSGGFLYTSPATGVINVPAGATIGTTRMRVVADYWNTGFGPCAWATGGASQGEMEDYTFKVVAPPPALTISSASSTQCAGVTSPTVSITSTLASFDTYSWSPSAGVTGTAASGYTFTAGSTIVYTLTGTQTTAPFSTNTTTFTYNANALPTPITITTTPATPTTCQSGPPVKLVASGGVVSGVPVLSEDFNGGAIGWTRTNGSTGAAPLNSSWSLHPDGYAPTGPSWFATTLHSNDATNFIFSDSDSNGIGTTTLVDLVSPAFSLGGYTAASLKFWHYYKSWTPSTASVQISTNGTAGPWTTLQSYTSTTQGTPTAWVQVVLDLSSYVGQTNLAVRFDYSAGWGWGWGLDNFLVSGSATSSITWNNAGSLWLDSAMTNPYVAGTGAITVYALPSANTTYTASASTISPVCNTNTTQAVTIIPIVGGTTSPSTQSVCNGTVSNISVSGQSGTIVWQADSGSGYNDVSGSSGVTTLTSAILGPVTTNTSIRVKVTNGTCTTYSTISTITVPVTTWNGSAWSASAPTSSVKAVFAGNYSSSGDLNACSVQVNSGNVVFNSTHNLIVQNGVTVSGGTLTFNNNASLVQVNDAAVNSGYVTYKRDAQPMIQYDYTYWSSPLTPQTLVGLSPLTLSDKYFTFNAGSNTYTNVASNSLMNAGTGYIIRAPQGYTASPQVFNGIFNGGSNDGVPNNGVYTTPITKSGSNNFNLIGNPYPSYLSANAFYAANSSLIDGNFYFWTHNTAINPTQYTQSDYAQWNSTGGVGTQGGGTGNTTIPDGKIASGQGFFVKGILNGTNNATFNNSMRLVGVNNNFFRISGSQSEPVVEKHHVWLELKNSTGAYKQTLVGYVQGATNEMDLAFDGAMASGGNVAGFYSVLGDNKLGIQGRALPFNVNDLVPMGYTASTAGDFEIALSNADGLFADVSQGIYLEDKLLNIIHNLRLGSYPFTTAAGTFDDRFVLRYTDGTSLGVNNPGFSDQNVVVYKNDSGIHIFTGSITMANVKIYDARGRLIYTKSNIGSSQTLIKDLDAAQEILIVRIQSIDDKVVNKKVVY